MRRHGLPFWGDVETEEEKPHHPSPFDILTKLALPLALAIFALLQEQQTRFLALIGFALLSFIVGLYQPIRNLVVRSFRRIRENRTAEQNFPQFRTYVRRFGEFVKSQNSDTLQAILLSELCGNNTTEFQRFYVPEVRFFNDRWHFFNTRLDQEEGTLENLQHYVSEFGNLIGEFNGGCVSQVFDRFPLDLRDKLSPTQKSSLNLFQQKYANFLQDYMNFIRGIESSLPTIQFSATYFSLPKPL